MRIHYIAPCCRANDQFYFRIQVLHVYIAQKYVAAKNGFGCHNNPICVWIFCQYRATLGPVAHTQGGQRASPVWVDVSIWCTDITFYELMYCTVFWGLNMVQTHALIACGLYICRCFYMMCNDHLWSGRLYFAISQLWWSHCVLILIPRHGEKESNGFRCIMIINHLTPIPHT